MTDGNAKISMDQIITLPVCKVLFAFCICIASFEKEKVSRHVFSFELESVFSLTFEPGAELTNVSLSWMATIMGYQSLLASDSWCMVSFIDPGDVHCDYFSKFIKKNLPEGE